MEALSRRVRALERRRCGYVKANDEQSSAIEFEDEEDDVKYAIYREQIRALQEDFKEERADRVRLKEQVDNLKGINAKLKQQCAQAELRFGALVNGRRKKAPACYECDFPDDAKPLVSKDGDDERCVTDEDMTLRKN
jgi:SMC interacting uncharacterized protein involved in chromosome segregation